MLNSEVVRIRDNSFFVASIASIKLLFVGGLVIDKEFSIGKGIILEHLRLTNSKAQPSSIPLLNVRQIIHQSSINIWT